LKWGHDAAWLQDIADKDGRVPAALLRKPDVPEELRLLVDGFWALCGSRQWTLSGPAPLPVSEMAAYLAAVHPGLSPEWRGRAIRLWGRMDQAYLEDIMARSQQGPSSIKPAK